jgi:hypothetical protein
VQITNLLGEAEKLRADVEKNGQSLDLFRRFAQRIQTKDSQVAPADPPKANIFERHRGQSQAKKSFSLYMKETGKNHRLEQIKEQERQIELVERKNASRAESTDNSAGGTRNQSVVKAI